jgi:MFS family permease
LAISDQQREAPPANLRTGRNAVYSITLAGGVTLHALNLYIAATVLPSVVRDIGGLDYYAWSTTLFVIASIVGSAATPSLLGASGPRGAYLVAAITFAAGSLVCAFAPNMAMLLVGRTIQGLGGGLFYALAYAVMRLVFPESLWARALALITAVWGAATLVGPAIGGIFADADDWRAAFWSLAPVALLFAVVAGLVLPAHAESAQAKPGTPFLQLALLIGSVLALSVGSVSANRLAALAGIAVTIVLIGALVLVEAKSSRRIMPKGGLDLRTRLGALYAMIALLILTLQPDIFVPLFLQELHGQSPLMAGYIAALLSIGWTVASLVGSKWSGTAAERAIRTAPFVVLAGLVTLAFFLPMSSAGRWSILSAISIGVFVIGFGIGAAWPHIVTSIFRTAAADEQTRAAGAVSTVQLFASAIGAAAAGMVANGFGLVDPGGAAGAARAAFALCAVFAGVAILAAMLSLRLRGAEPAGSTPAVEAGKK